MNFIFNFIRFRIAHRPNLVKIIENIGWLSYDQLLRMGVGFFIGVWIVRYLGPEQFGVLSFAGAFVGLFGAFTALGLPSIVVRDIANDPDCTTETLGTAAVLQFISGIVNYFLILAAIAYLRPNDIITQTIVAILGSMLLFEASKVSVLWFESQVLSKYTVWVQNSVFLAFTVIKIILILQWASLIAFVWVMLAEMILVAIILLGFMNKFGPSLVKLRFNSKRAKLLLKDSWPLLISAISITIYLKIDQIMLGQMIGDESVGVYSAALRISEVWYFIPMVIVASVFPTILKAKKVSEEQYYKRLQKLYDLMVLISVGVAVPISFLSTPIVTLLFGEAYHGAGIILAIHIWTMIFVSLGVASGKWFLAENRQMLSLQRTGIGAIVNIFLNFLLIPKFGGVGAALSTLVAQIATCFLFDIIQAETRKMFYMKLKAFNLLRINSFFRQGVF
jgi:O-antigen/teichoic acid export membrane protein